LKVNGRDLLDMGYKPDKSIKETLNWLLEQVIDEPELNTREMLINLIKEHKRQ
jgi:tRNA nucleotidyltransferase (CCA-adding enzyme)